MTELQKKKILWLTRAKLAEQKLNALSAVRKHDEQLLAELNYFGEDTTVLSAQLTDTLTQTEAQLHTLLTLREEIRNTILSLPDLQMQTILLRKYLSYETNEKIADAMFYDVRTIQRKHKQALDQISLPAGTCISETTIFPNISCEN